MRITFDELPLLVGSSRQVLLWKSKHFHFFKQVVDAWKLTDDFYSVHRTVSGAAELQAMATQAEIRIENLQASKGDNRVPQIDSMALVDPPVFIRRRCAVLTKTHPASAFRSSFELLLIVLVTLVLAG